MVILSKLKILKIIVKSTIKSLFLDFSFQKIFVI